MKFNYHIMKRGAPKIPEGYFDTYYNLFDLMNRKGLKEILPEDKYPVVFVLPYRANLLSQGDRERHLRRSLLHFEKQNKIQIDYSSIKAAMTIWGDDLMGAWIIITRRFKDLSRQESRIVVMKKAEGDEK